VRLLFDEHVTGAVKGRLILALVYLLVPFDLLPEIALGPPALIDDAFLLVVVLTSLLDDDVVPRGRVQQHWSGSPEKLNQVLQGAAFLREHTDFFRYLGDWANRTWNGSESSR